MMEIVCNGIDISDYAVSIIYTKSTSSLGAKIQVVLQNVKLADEYMPEIDIGNRISVINDSSEAFNGMVTDIALSKTAVSITAYDECYRLNKSQVTIQFDDGMTVQKAIQAVLQQIGIKIGNLPLMKCPVECLFYAQTPAEIIKQLIDTEESANGGKYYMTSERTGYISIYMLGEKSSGVTIEAISDATRSRSLDDVRNSITLLVDNGDSYTESESAKNADSIARFGEIRQYLKTTLEADSAVSFVQNKLSELSAILDTGQITITPCDWRLSVGSTITVKEPITGLSGTYIMESVTHEEKNGKETTTIGIKTNYKYTPFNLIMSEHLAPEIQKIEDSRKYTLVSPDTSYKESLNKKGVILDIIGRMNHE